MNLKEILVLLNKEFPGIDARDASLFYGKSTEGVWFAGTESAVIEEEITFTESDGTKIREIFDSPVFESELHMETFGTHPKLESFLKEQGWYSEAYDSGTLMAFK